MAVAVSPDGATVFVTGDSVASGHVSDYATLAYDAATGAQRWLARYNGPANYFDEATALAVSPDGSTVFVTGQSDGSTVNLDYATVAYDASTGVEKWVARYDDPDANHDWANAVSVSPDGTMVFVTGRSWGDSALSDHGKVLSHYDYATVAYDAATGAESWVARYNGPGNDYDEGNALAVSPDGGTVFVTGGSDAADLLSDYATFAYDAATGAEKWIARYNGPGDDFDWPNALGVSPDGASVFVTGESVGSGTSWVDYATVAYDPATGAEKWVARYNGPGDGFDEANALGVSPDGAIVFVTGRAHSAGTFYDDYDYGTIAYDATSGAEKWKAGYNDPASEYDAAYALVVSSDGSLLYVTGGSSDSRGHSDFATLVYDAATGDRLELGRSGRGTPTALAVSPDGSKLFVTGVLGPSPRDDYGTLAYLVSP